MASKNFKIKEGLTLQGTTDTNITADNSGGILIGGNPLSSFSAPTLGSTSISSGATVTTIAGLTLTSPTINTPTLTLSTAASTSQARIAWDQTNSQLDIGDGTTIRTITADNAIATLTNKTLSNATLTGTLTAGGGVGTSGQVLSSTGTGTQWIASSPTNIPNTSLQNSSINFSNRSISLGGSINVGELLAEYVHQGLITPGQRDALFLTDTKGRTGSTSINAVAVQANGQILIGSGATDYNGAALGRVVRLNTDGSVDSSFMANTGTGADNAVRGIAVQPDGRILVIGNFNAWNGFGLFAIVRLNADGTRDTTFTGANAANWDINAVEALSNGKILLGGRFTTWGGTAVNRMVRLNADGSRDTTFVLSSGTYATNDIIRDIAVQPNGQIVVTGDLTTWGGTTVNRIVRLDADGATDTSFVNNTGTGANSSISQIATQSDNKIVVVGGFTTWNGTTVGNIVRLNSNGTRDTGFTANNGSGANSTINSLAIQSDGQILLGGNFNTWNGLVVANVIQLDLFGSRNTTFSTNLGTGASSQTQTAGIVVQPDGRIVVVGSFTAWSGTNVGGIMRLLSTGAPDPVSIASFVTYGPNNLVHNIAVQPNGQIVVTGDFTTWNGSTANRITRLNPDGTRDLIFAGNTETGIAPDSWPISIAVQPDNRVILGGSFSSLNGVSANRIVRLNVNGTRDTAFEANITSAGPNGPIRGLALQPNGQIIVVGNFTTWGVVTVNRIVRLNADGTRDATFTTNTGTAASDNNILCAAIQANGQIVLGGDFTTWNTVTVNRIVRLNADGTRDTTFTTNAGTGSNGSIRAIAIQPNGLIVVGGIPSTWNGVSVRGLVRLNTNGTRDTTFTTNMGTAMDAVNALVVQADNRVLIGSSDNSWNGTAMGGYPVVRLNPDGTRDLTFATNVGVGGSNNQGITALAIQPDGRVLAGGNFTTWSGPRVSRIVRLFGGPR